MTSTFGICSQCQKINRLPIASIMRDENAPEKSPVCGNCQSILLFDGLVQELSAESLTLLTGKSPLPVVVDFWAPWCGPCRSFAPTFQEAARQMAGKAVFAKLNTEAHPMASDTYRIRGIPCFVIFDDGREKSRQSGAMPLPAFLNWIDSVIPMAKSA